MGGIADVLMVIIVLGGAWYLWDSGKLDEIFAKFTPQQKQTQQTQQGGGVTKIIRRHHPAVQQQTPTPPMETDTGVGDTSGGEDATAPRPTPVSTGGGGTGASKTGKNIYPVVAPINSPPNVTIRGGGNSYRDNISYPCNKCAREATWIFKPGTSGDWSPKLGSHGDEGGKETLIELANIQMNGTGGTWQCEGAHMNYNKVSGGTGSAPRLAGKAQVGIKAATWPLGGNRVHHELWYDETGTGNSWKKFAEFSGAATGCNAITCPVPGSKCQDTMRLDNPSGHQFIARSMNEIRPPGAAGGGQGGIQAAFARVTAPW